VTDCFCNINSFIISKTISLFALSLNIGDKKCFLSTKSPYRQISEGYYDTEDWSKDSENSALPSQE